jgi:DNA-directed RNA polymerase subunit M/transcription elongation factor TFIIS
VSLSKGPQDDISPKTHVISINVNKDKNRVDFFRFLNGNVDQISKLRNLTMHDDSKMFILDDYTDDDDRSDYERERRESIELLYQISLQILEFGFDTVYDYLTSEVWYNRKDIYLNSPALTPARDKFKLYVDLYQSKPEVSKGLYKCPKCGSKEVLTAESQTRSADEPLTVFAKCIHCNKQWTMG